jgi:hypothetical protein
MNTAYPRERIASPYQKYRNAPVHPIEQLRKESRDVQNTQHPARKIIESCLGSFSIQAVVEEDSQTLNTMGGTEGLISFLCTLTKDGRVLSQGRGSSILSPASANRYIQRSIACAYNSAFSDAAIRASKVLDTLRNCTGEPASEPTNEPATQKQLDYLLQLIRENVTNDIERERMEQEARRFTKEQASRAIESFRQ